MKRILKGDHLEEVKAMKKLIYPGVCRLFDVFMTQDCVYLVMKLVEGRELFEVVKEEKCLPEPRARNIFSQLVRALQYLHSMGTLHNDLKLENVLINEAEEATLIDFGHASISDAPTFKPGVPTLEYVAPEILLYGRSSEIVSAAFLPCLSPPFLTPIPLFSRMFGVSGSCSTS